MSEYINNPSKRKESLKEIIRKLHEGQSVEALQAEFNEIIAQTTASEIAEAEREVIEEGMPVTDIQKLCDLHVAVFQEGLETQPEPESQPGHPIFQMRLTNEVIGRIADVLETLLVDLPLENQQTLERLRKAVQNLPTVVEHYNFKENLLFPYLEQHGFEGPAKVMWGVHNDIRAEIKQVQNMLAQADFDVDELDPLLEKLTNDIREMIYKEEKILIPESLARLTEEEWLSIREESEGGVKQEYKAPQQAQVAMSQPAAVSSSVNIPAPSGVGQIGLNTGALTAEQIDLMLRSLPIDITFVDENDEVRFFSQTPERIFTRTSAIIGRKVQNCHPPQSVHVVQAIVDDFKSGKKDAAEFWIPMGEKFVHIRYFAMRDSNGSYRGTLEVTQDVADIRALEGERRILDEA